MIARKMDVEEMAKWWNTRDFQNKGTAISETAWRTVVKTGKVKNSLGSVKVGDAEAVAMLNIMQTCLLATYCK